jgi:NUMOD4 motif
MEQWLPLAGYPGYEASDRGRIRNSRKHVLTPSCKSGDTRPFVGLVVNGVQVQRNLSLLICRTFWDRPKESFDTPIHLDGDLSNCRIDNLVWRPRWFALRHIRQFRLNLGETGAVRDINTGIVYDNTWHVVFTHGVLYNDVIMSIVNKTWVFPIMHCFEWVDPE